MQKYVYNMILAETLESVAAMHRSSGRHCLTFTPLCRKHWIEPGNGCAIINALRTENETPQILILNAAKS